MSSCKLLGQMLVRDISSSVTIDPLVSILYWIAIAIDSLLCEPSIDSIAQNFVFFLQPLAMKYKTTAYGKQLL